MKKDEASNTVMKITQFFSPSSQTQNNVSHISHVPPTPLHQKILSSPIPPNPQFLLYAPDKSPNSTTHLFPSSSSSFFIFKKKKTNQRLARSLEKEERAAQSGGASTGPRLQPWGASAERDPCYSPAPVARGWERKTADALGGAPTLAAGRRTATPAIHLQLARAERASRDTPGIRFFIADFILLSIGGVSTFYSRIFIGAAGRGGIRDWWGLIRDICWFNGGILHWSLCLREIMTY